MTNKSISKKMEVNPMPTPTLPTQLGNQAMLLQFVNPEFTPEENALILAMIKMGKKIQEIVEALPEHSPDSVMTQVMQLRSENPGLTPEDIDEIQETIKESKESEYTPEESDQIFKMVAEGKTVAEMVRMFPSRSFTRRLQVLKESEDLEQPVPMLPNRTPARVEVHDPLPQFKESKFTPEENDQILKMIDKGKTRTEITKMLPTHSTASIRSRVALTKRKRRTIVPFEPKSGRKKPEPRVPTMYGILQNKRQGPHTFPFALMDTAISHMSYDELVDIVPPAEIFNAICLEEDSQIPTDEMENYKKLYEQFLKTGKEPETEEPKPRPDSIPDDFAYPHNISSFGYRECALRMINMLPYATYGWRKGIDTSTPEGHRAISGKGTEGPAVSKFERGELDEDSINLAIDGKKDEDSVNVDIDGKKDEDFLNPEGFTEYIESMKQAVLSAQERYIKPKLLASPKMPKQKAPAYPKQSLFDYESDNESEDDSFSDDSDSEWCGVLEEEEDEE